MKRVDCIRCGSKNTRVLSWNSESKYDQEAEFECFAYGYLYFVGGKISKSERSDNKSRFWRNFKKKGKEICGLT